MPRNLFREVVFAASLPIHVGRRAVQPAAERVRVAERDRDHLHPEPVELLHLGRLARLHAHRLRVEHQAVHGKPDARIAKGRRLVVGGRSRVHDPPAVRFEDAALGLREAPGRVVDDEAGAEGHERRVDVDRPRVPRKVHRVHPVVREVAAQPLHTPPVGGEPVLAEEVPADPQHVGRIEERLVLGGHEVEGRGPAQPLLDGDLVEPPRLVGLAGEARTRRLLPAESGVLVEVALHERVIGEVLEVPAPEGHRGAQDLAPHGQQHVAGRHAAEHAARREVRRRHRLVPLDGGRAVYPDPAPFEDRREVVELRVRPLHGFEGPRPPSPAHGAVLRDLGFRRGLRRRDAGVVGPPHDEVAERVEVVPRTDDGGAAGAHPHTPSLLRASFRPAPQPCPVSTRPAGPLPPRRRA